MTSDLQIIPDSGFGGFIPPQASSDEHLLVLWLNQYRTDPKTKTNTSRAYDADLRAFRAFANQPLRTVTIHDLQAFAATLTALSDATRCRRLSSVKSLFAFAHRIGYLPFDVGAPIKLPAIKDTLAERIMSEEQVQRLLWQADAPERRGPFVKRDAALLRLLYSGGLRISEVCGLRWRDLTERDEAGQIAVFGKGGKTRVILLPTPMWSRLTALRGMAEPDHPVFRSRKGGKLNRSQAHLIVKAAVRRARLPSGISAHFLRHSHASHALDRKCPVHVVQHTLGHASLQTTTRYSHARPDDSSSKYLSA